MSPRDVWQTTLGELQVQLTRATYDTWLKQTHALSLDGDCLVVGVPNDYSREWLEQRLHPAIQRALQRVVGRPLSLSFVVRRATAMDPDSASPLFDFDSASADRPSHRLPAPHRNGGGSGDKSQANLNSRYTFDHFVVGGGNRMAHAAAVAAAENAATKYNPLFLYGGVGLGKTHLLHAIGHAALERGAHVISVSSESFANDLIASIRTQSTERFRDTYRAANVLLIDDIHFIAGKESTQEEFFHTFNALHAANGQIVMTSDRPPAAIATLEERLRSRFQWGLIVDIEPPDLETRIAILRSKAETRFPRVPDPALELIANTIQQNVRELEGALNRVLAYCHCNKVEPSMDVVRKALADLMVRRDPPPLDEVMGIVAEFFGISGEELCGRSRTARVAEPRQVAMYLMREESHASYPQIGEFLSRDHTTILHGHDKIARLLEQDSKLRRDVMQLRERLYAA